MFADVFLKHLIKARLPATSPLLEVSDHISREARRYLLLGGCFLRPTPAARQNGAKRVRQLGKWNGGGEILLSPLRALGIDHFRLRLAIHTALPPACWLYGSGLREHHPRFQHPAST